MKKKHICFLFLAKWVTALNAPRPTPPLFNGKITKCIKDNLTTLFIHSRLNGIHFERDTFNVFNYYSQHHEKVDMHKNIDNKIESTLLYYIEYGYWFNVNLSHISNQSDALLIDRGDLSRYISILIFIYIYIYIYI